MAEPKVVLVLVSHSAKLAEGLAELAGQMATDVRIAAAGGDALECRLNECGRASAIKRFTAD